VRGPRSLDNLPVGRTYDSNRLRSLPAEESIRTVRRSPPADETDSVPRVRKFRRQEYNSDFSMSGRIVTRSSVAWSVMPDMFHALEARSGGAWSVKPDMSHALEEVVLVRSRRRGSSRTRQMVTRSGGGWSEMPDISLALEARSGGG
jgi:hypothetical protein